MREIYDEQWEGRLLVHYFDDVPARYKHISLPLESHSYCTQERIAVHIQNNLTIKKDEHFIV